MKTKNTLAKRGALIAVLILGNGAWLIAQDNPGQTPGQTPRQTPGQIGGYENGVGRQRETNTTDTTSTSTNTTMQTKRINKGSVLIGTTVKNQQGEELGKIRDLVIDFSSDRVAYVVLASKTGMLTSSKLHAVPLRAFQPDADGTSLILNAEKDQFERSTGFDKDNWPAIGNAAWGAEPLWKDYQGTNTTQTGRDGLREGQDTNLQNRDYPDNKDKTREPYRNDPLAQPKR